MQMALLSVICMKSMNVTGLYEQLDEVLMIHEY